MLKHQIKKGNVMKTIFLAATVILPRLAGGPAIAADMRTRRFSWARLRGVRLHRETAWVYLKTDHASRAISEVLRVFDGMKDQFGGKPPSA